MVFPLHKPLAATKDCSTFTQIAQILIIVIPITLETYLIAFLKVCSAQNIPSTANPAVTTKQIERLKVGAWAPRTDEQVIERIRALAEHNTVAEIVDVLNREGLRSAHGRLFREHHVLYLARRHRIPVTTSARRLRHALH